MNSNASPFVGPVLSIPHREGSRYFDAWKGQAVTPEITADGRAFISLSLEAGGVGCIVESW
jgi:gamma-glutamyl hercynylcysteine S-oxide synthase